VNERSEHCTWCDQPVERNEGYRVGELPGARRATFCRLEHVVPWTIQGPHWEAGELEEPAGLTDAIERCSVCAEPLGEVRVVLIRRRGEHRIPDGFCSADHLAAWARSGGRYAP
jgi:hypothetical protein